MLTRIKLLVAVLFAATALTSPAHAAELPLLAVFAGQSNMAGFGTTGTDVPAHLVPALSNVYIRRDLAPAGDPPRYGFAAYQTGVNSTPSAKLGAAQKWGPEAEFGFRWAQANPSRDMYIAKSATSGSQLERTTVAKAAGAPDADWNVASHELFDNVITSVAAAKAELAAQGITAFETVIFWMQGESDASNAVTAASYEANLTELITQARLQWGVNQDSTPFILGRITTKWPLAGQVRNALAHVAAADPFTRMVSTDGFTLASDNKHYTAAGQQALGGAFYECFESTYTETPVSMDAQRSLATEEQPVNGVTLTTVTAANTPSPSATYDFAGGETAGLAVNAETGAVAVVNGASLSYAADPVRVLTVRATNGVNTATTALTIMLTESGPVTDVTGTVLRIDPANSPFTTVVDGLFSSLSDTYGTGRILSQATASRRPQQTFTGWASCDGGDSIGMSAATIALATDQDTAFALAAIATPRSGGTAASGYVAALTGGSSSVKYGVFYDFTQQKFGVAALSAGNGTTQPARSTATFAPDATYRILVTRAGTTINLFVDGIAAPLGAFTNPVSTTVLYPGTIGARAMLGGAGLTSGSFHGDIGLVRFIQGAPSHSEVLFLEGEFTGWLAG